jgi:glycosyltransferase involved in cell wall biosynthesis
MKVEEEKGVTHTPLSVIIPTYNREKDLSVCLNSILQQTKWPKEVIIVDDSDNDKIENLIKEQKVIFKNKNIDLRYIRNKRERGNAIARNEGIDNSTGDIVLFLDDDVILDRDYIKEITCVYNNDLENRVGGVVGNILHKNRKMSVGTFISSSLEKLFFLPQCGGNGKFKLSGCPTGHFELADDRIHEVEVLSGANMSFRRGILNEFRFDENLKGYAFREDGDLAYRVSRKYKNIYTPFAKLIHNLSPTARDNDYARLKKVMENSYYFFKKNFPQDFKHKCAFWWSVVGLFVMAMIGRNKEGLKGLIEGILNIKLKGEVLINIQGHAREKEGRET